MPVGEAHTPTAKLSSKSTGKGGGVTKDDSTKGAQSTGTERALGIGLATSTKANGQHWRTQSFAATAGTGADANGEDARTATGSWEV
jgi:hypothetical protein